MKTETFNENVGYMIGRSQNVLVHKAKEYATEDRLHNFKVAADIQNTTPINALGGMMAKHTISVYDMIQGDTKGVEYPIELWEEKITDHINYLLLLYNMVKEPR